MSQTRPSLDEIESRAGLSGLLLRPLSAGLLPKTFPEMKGIVDREKLGRIEGRSQRAQSALAERFGITKFFSHAGGCLLTDIFFCTRLRDLKERDAIDIEDIDLLKSGRHFRLDGSTKVVVGKNAADCDALRSKQRPGDVLFELRDGKGPIALLRSPAVDDSHMATAASLCVSHSKSRQLESAAVTYWTIGDEARNGTFEARPLSRDAVNAMRL